MRACIRSAVRLAVVVMGLGAWSGCGEAPRPATLELELEAIELRPGAQKQVRLASGEARAAVAPQCSGLTASIADGHLVVAAGPKARQGKHVVTVKGLGVETALVVCVGLRSAVRTRRPL